MLLVAALDFLASARWRKSRHLHWAERARLIFPARRTTPVNLFLLAICAVFFGWYHSAGYSPALIPFALAAFVGGILGAFPLERTLFPELTLRAWLIQSLQGWGSRALLFGPLFLVGMFMPREWNWQLATIAILFGVFYVWFGSIGYFQVLIWLNLLKPASPATLAPLEPCFAATGLRPRVRTMQSPLALAFAIPFRQELLFTDSFFAKLPPDQIQAITYHELAHLTEGKFTSAQRLLGLLAFYPLIFIRPLFDTWRFAGFIPIYVFFFLVLFFTVRLHRKMEHRADAEAAARETNEGTYARALETIYRVNLIPAVMPSRGQTHPHLYDRMVAAGLTPDFLRPKPPRTLHWTFIVPIVLLTVLLFARP